jgi:hypothetical protein
LRNGERVRKERLTFGLEATKTDAQLVIYGGRDGTQEEVRVVEISRRMVDGKRNCDHTSAGGSRAEEVREKWTNG